MPPGCAESLRQPTHHTFYTNIRNSHIDTIVFARTGSIHLITSRFHTLFFTSLGGCSGSKRNPHQVRSISAFIMSPCSRSTRGETAPARTIAAWLHKEKSWTCMKIEDFTIRSRDFTIRSRVTLEFYVESKSQSWDIWGWSSRRPAKRLILSGIMVNSWKQTTPSVWLQSIQQFKGSIPIWWEQIVHLTPSTLYYQKSNFEIPHVWITYFH